MAGKEYLDSYYVTLLIIIPASIPLIQNLGIEIHRAENKHIFRSVVYEIIAILNIIISVILIPKYGVFGATIGTALALLIGNGLIMNIYYNKNCNIDIIYFWKNIISLSISFVIPIVVSFVLNKLDLELSIINLLIKIFIYSLAYVTSMWLFGMNEFEKNLIIKPIRRIFKNNDYK